MISKIDISGNRSYSENFSQYFRANEMGVFNFYTPTNGGSFSISYLMTATSFSNGDDLFNNLLNYRQDIARRLAYSNAGWIGMGEPMVMDTIGHGEFPYGYGANSQEVLTYAFLAAYGGKNPGNVSLSLFKNIALPNWSINFTGLTKIPAISKIFKTVSITHSYRSTYSISSWATNINYDANNSMSVYEGTYMRIPEYDMSQIMVTEQFAPLIGVTLAFKNSFSPSFEYKKSRTVTMSFSNNQLTEVEGREIVIGMGYTFKDLSFIVSSVGGGNTRRTSNDLTLKLDVGFRRNKTTLRSIDEAYSQISAGQDKINVYLTGDYNFSTRLGMQLFYKYDVTNPFVANSFKTSNTYAGVTLRFSLVQ